MLNLQSICVFDPDWERAYIFLNWSWITWFWKYFEASQSQASSVSSRSQWLLIFQISVESCVSQLTFWCLELPRNVELNNVMHGNSWRPPIICHSLWSFSNLVTWWNWYNEILRKMVFCEIGQHLEGKRMFAYKSICYVNLRMLSSLCQFQRMFFKMCAVTMFWERYSGRKNFS